MAVQINHLEIEGFRCIDSLTITLSGSEPNIIIGPNNSGKTTLLDALGLCLQSPKFFRYQLDDNDFNVKDGKSAESFEIRAYFSKTNGNDLPLVRGGVGDPVEVSGVKVFASRAGGEIQHRLLNDAGEDILLSKGVPMSKASKEKYKGKGLGGGRRYAYFSEIKDSLPEIWQLDAKTLYQSLYEWKSGPLQRLLEMYKKSLLSEEWETTPSGKKMPAALSQAHGFLSKEAMQTPFWTKTVAPKIKAKFQEYLGKGADLNIEPGLNSVDAWILSQLILNVSPGNGMPPLDAKRMGDGWQSLLRLAALEIVTELQKEQRPILLIIEEPETYLHPHLRRKMRSIFQKMAQKGYQVVATTHSAEITSIADAQMICRLSLNSNGVSHAVFPTASASDAVKLEAKMTEHGTAEMLFANKVVIVEGKGDTQAVNIGCQISSIDIDAMSVSILGIGGVTEMPEYARICNALNIPWLAIIDLDIQLDGNRNPKTQGVHDKLNDLISKGAGGTVLTWDNDLETALTCPEKKAHENNWLHNNLFGKTWLECEAEPKFAKYVETMNQAKAWLNG